MCNKQEVEVIADDICYSEFYEKYLVNNKLCLLSKSFTDSWPCRTLWVKNGAPNWEYFVRNYGLADVPVANCGESFFDSHAKSSWTMKDYISYIIKYSGATYPPRMPCLYLKDWHLVKAFPESIEMYEVLKYFSVDWLNEHWVLGGQDDYRFVYIGPKGSWTSLHADVYGSFSWSANIVGKKRWIFLPPGEEVKLKSILGVTSLPCDLDEVDLNSLPVTYVDLIQNAGEVVFVPSGWFHQVWNLEDTISINHNWFNGANINHIYKALLKASGEVEAELSGYGVSDLDKEQRDIVLNSHHGMNFQQFRLLLQTVIDRRDQGFLSIYRANACRTCSGDQLCNEEIHRISDRKIAHELLNYITNK